MSPLSHLMSSGSSCQLEVSKDTRKAQANADETHVKERNKLGGEWNRFQFARSAPPLHR